MATVILLQNAGFTYICSINTLDLQQGGWRSRILRETAGNAIEGAMVPIFYARLQTAFEAITQLYKDLYSVIRPGIHPHRGFKIVEVHGNTNLHDIIGVEKYQRTHDLRIETNIEGGHFMKTAQAFHSC